MKKAARVYLVGAGPGDPGLITLRGAECLGRADLVLYDYLVNSSILQHAREGAELVCLGRHGHGKILPQEEVTRQMIEAAQSGKTVVRLKGGDPAVFARLSEEAEPLTQANIPFEIVPGITAAWAASAYAGIPLTDRRLSSAVALVTGQEGNHKSGSLLDYAALAKFPGTLVFYMGVTTAGTWTSELMGHGKDPAAPAAIIRRCSWPDQQLIRCELQEVSELLDQQRADRIRPPVIVIVGSVAGIETGWNWFVERPLFGQTILVTRPRKQAQSLRDRLEELGAKVLLQPAIEIAAPADWSPVDKALSQIEQFDWLVFSSSNGVRYLLDRLCQPGSDLRRLGGVKLACIGPGTADELARWNLTADCIPDEYRAESLASKLAEDAAGKKYLLARASRGREVLAEELTAAGGHVEQVVVYESRDAPQADPSVASSLEAGEIDWITVTSSAIAHSLVALFGESLRRSRLVSISPITSETLRELGYEPAAEAEVYTMDGVIDAVIQAAKAT